MNDTTKPDSNPSKPGVAAAGSKGKPTAAPAKPATPGSAKPAAAPPPAGKPAASGNRKRLIIAGVGIAAALAAVPAFNHFNKPAATSTAAPADIGPTVASGKIKDAPPPAPPGWVRWPLTPSVRKKPTRSAAHRRRPRRPRRLWPPRQPRHRRPNPPARPPQPVRQRQPKPTSLPWHPPRPNRQKPANPPLPPRLR